MFSHESWYLQSHKPTKTYQQHWTFMLQIHLTSLDFTLLSAFAPFWVYNDMTARKWWAFGNSWVLLSHFKLWNPLLEEFITITFICLSQVWQRFLASSLISGTIFRSSVVPCPKAITNNNAYFTQPHYIQVWMRITFFDSHKIFTFFVLMSIASWATLSLYGEWSIACV